MNEKQLLKKLLINGHLSVPERRLLPDGKADRNLLVNIIVDELQLNGQFPFRYNFKDNFEGGLIVCSQDERYTVCKKAEISLNTYQIVSEEEYTDPRSAAEAYLKVEYRDQIDGIPIK